MVTTPGANEQAAIRAIHGLGAKAYRYVQFYWAPKQEIYEGIDLGRHPEWAFCRPGTSHCVAGRTTEADGAKRDWYFLDTNERGLRSKIAKIMASYKAKGWDGLDRGTGGCGHPERHGRGRPGRLGRDVLVHRRPAQAGHSSRTPTSTCWGWPGRRDCRSC